MLLAVGLMSTSSGIFPEPAVVLISCCRFHVGGYAEKMPCGPDRVESYNEISGGNMKVPDGMRAIIENLQVPIATNATSSTLYSKTKI